MNFTFFEDISSLRIHLNELQSKFERLIMHGESPANLKEIHLQIKELECHINAMDWDPDIHANRDQATSPSNEYPPEQDRSNDRNRRRVVEEEHSSL